MYNGHSRISTYLLCNQQQEERVVSVRPGTITQTLTTKLVNDDDGRPPESGFDVVSSKLRASTKHGHTPNEWTTHDGVLVERYFEQKTGPAGVGGGTAYICRSHKTQKPPGSECMSKYGAHAPVIIVLECMYLSGVWCRPGKPVVPMQLLFCRRKLRSRNAEDGASLGPRIERKCMKRSVLRRR
jgi:hypothetical protein